MAVPGFLSWMTLPMWGILLQPLGFILFLTCIMAENKRPPFDAPEGESELVAGYHMEYSGMRFGLFYTAEFLEVPVIGTIVTSLFLGGWSIPWLSTADIIGGVSGVFGQGFATGLCIVLHVLSFLLKVVVMIWLQMAIRWTLPRFRYDQLMSLGWKVMLPLALVYIMVTTVAIWVIETVAGIGNPRLAMGILFGLNLVLGYLVFFVLDRGLILSGSYRAPRPAAPGASRAGMAV
jgi:NADH-quinone oxidoreductase subunit H